METDESPMKTMKRNRSPAFSEQTNHYTHQEETITCLQMKQTNHESPNTERKLIICLHWKQTTHESPRGIESPFAGDTHEEQAFQWRNPRSEENRWGLFTPWRSGHNWRSRLSEGIEAYPSHPASPLPRASFRWVFLFFVVSFGASPLPLGNVKYIWKWWW